MKTSLKQKLLAAVLLFVLASSTAQAQNDSSLDSHPTLAPAEPPDSGGAAKDQQAELAKKLQDPVADLISVPIQNNWDFGIGPAHAMKYTVNIQPVIPFSISKDWNLITRTILPVIYAEAVDNNPLAPASARKSHSGLGDTTQSFFLSPKALVGGWVLGAGPVMYYPTTDRALRAGDGARGPTIVALGKSTVSRTVLASKIWSFAGWVRTSAFLQPFFTYHGTHTTFGLNTRPATGNTAGGPCR
jgi:hypothetical protein